MRGACEGSRSMSGTVLLARDRWQAVVENVGGIDDCEGTFVAVFGERQLLQAGTEGFGDGFVAEAYTEDVVSVFTMLDECEKFSGLGWNSRSGR